MLLNFWSSCLDLVPGMPTGTAEVALCTDRDGAQGFTHARQAPHQLSHVSHPYQPPCSIPLWKGAPKSLGLLSCWALGFSAAG